ALWDIEAADRALEIEKVQRLRSADEVAAANLAANIGRPGDAFGPRVCGEEREAIAHAPLKLHLQRVVIGGAVRFISCNGALEELVGAAGVHGRVAVGSDTSGAGLEKTVEQSDRLIEIRIRDSEMSVLGADIRGGELEFAGKRLLQGEVVLLDIGVLKVLIVGHGKRVSIWAGGRGSREWIGEGEIGNTDVAGQRGSTDSLTP